MSGVVRVGIVGAGLMGREIATAIGRWPSLVNHPVTPVVSAVCDINPDALAWFEKITTAKLLTTKFEDLLMSDQVDVLYIAVRHDLHEEMYRAAIEHGKDLLAEKPFGIDLASAQRIVATLDEHPNVFVRCSSELPFYPGAQAAINAVASGRFGQIVDVESGFWHSSDLDPDKPINWKRQARYCGEAGVMNDLGLHALHVPLRMGWSPSSVYALLQDVFESRPGPDGAPVPCDTFENALLATTVDSAGADFPMTVSVKRVAPGHKNTWFLRVRGLNGGVEYSTKNPKEVRFFEVRETPDGRREQLWSTADAGSQSVWPTVTGEIFETGFADSILQMWAAFLAERAGVLGDRFGCATPHEALEAHRIHAAALASHVSSTAVAPV